MAAGLDPETLELALESLRDFAKQRLPLEVLLDFDARDEMPIEIVREMCGPELGLQLFFVPEEYGGMGAGSFDVYRFCEALAAVDIGVATALLATFLGSDPIQVGGTPEQRERWLGAIAEQGILFAYGATEPEAGSDLAALRTTATAVEEEGRVVGYKLSGRKQWISNGGVAEAFTVLANAPGGPSWFVVERGAPGFDSERPEDKHGIRLSNTAALTLDEVPVGVDALVGGVEGQGLIQALSVFGYTRLMVAAFGLGGGWAALDRAIAYSTERIQAGGPLSEKAGYTHKLIVPHAARLEAARAYIEESAARLDEGEQGLDCEGAIAKYVATEAGNAAADAAIQALGGYGYTREYEVEKIKRDVRITTIYEGTSEIMEMTVSRSRWQLHVKTRGQHYHERAAELEALARECPGCGAEVAALALHAVAGALERARLGRLTRNQHVLLRLGEWIAHAECAASLARRAAAARAGRLPSKADARFDAAGLSLLSRIFAREAALRVASGGLCWLAPADASPVQTVELEDALCVGAIHRAQAGLLADTDAAADLVYGRSGGS
jgi:alkylation response protein AidB-like acyl-CoA dehydrogenase